VTDLILSLAISTATSLAGLYSHSLSPSPPPIRVEVEEFANPLRDARTVREMEGAGCVLKMRRTVLSRPDIVAHEVCHCIADYELLTPWGYRADVGREKVVELEAAAKSCERKMR
jgi:hypothetical protein